MPQVGPLFPAASMASLPLTSIKRKPQVGPHYPSNNTTNSTARWPLLKGNQYSPFSREQPMCPLVSCTHLANNADSCTVSKAHSHKESVSHSIFSTRLLRKQGILVDHQKSQATNDDQQEWYFWNRSENKSNKLLTGFICWNWRETLHLLVKPVLFRSKGRQTPIWALNTSVKPGTNTVLPPSPWHQDT